MRVLALSLGALPAFAQESVHFSYGPRIGYNWSTVQFTNHPSFKTSFRPGLEAGVTATLRVGHFALQPAVCYLQRGYRLEFTIPGDRVFEALHYTGSTRLDYLVLPLSLAYSLRADGQGWQVFAGPYVGVLLGGRYASNTAFVDPSTGMPGTAYVSLGPVASERSYDPDDQTTTHAQSVDAGLQGGLGYQHRSFLVQAVCSWGMRNVQYKNFAATVNYGDQSFPHYNRSAHLSLAYLFDAKH